jgi:hypothetical protein
MARYVVLRFAMAAFAAVRFDRPPIAERLFTGTGEVVPPARGPASTRAACAHSVST